MFEFLNQYSGEILLTSFLLLGFIVRGFTAPYLTEKAKNTATKEDIAGITKKVEGIRTQLFELSNFKATRRANQEKHLLSFHDAAVEMLHERFSVNFGDLPMDQGKSLFKFQTEFHENVVRLLKEHQRVILFLSKEHDLSTYASAVIRAALNSKIAFKNNFSEIKSTGVDEEFAYSSGDRHEYAKAVKKADEANKKYWSEMHPHIDEYRVALELYVNELNYFLANPDPK